MGQGSYPVLFLPMKGGFIVTVFSNVKATLANAKGIEAAFSDLALKTQDKDTKAIFHYCMMETASIVHDLQQRVEFMKAEELQYRNS